MTVHLAWRRYSMLCAVLRAQTQCGGNYTTSHVASYIWYSSSKSAYDKPALDMHQFGRGYEIFVTSKFPTSDRTSDVRRHDRVSYAVLCCVICLLPSWTPWIRPCYHMLHPLSSKPTSDFDRLAMCVTKCFQTNITSSAKLESVAAVGLLLWVLVRHLTAY